MVKIKKEIRKIRVEFIKTVTTFIVSSFGLMAALAWNKAIGETINKYLTAKESIFSWFLYAVVVTFFAVLVTIYLGRLADKYKQEEKKEEKNG